MMNLGYFRPEGKKQVDARNDPNAGINVHLMSNNAVFPAVDIPLPEVQHFHSKHTPSRYPPLKATIRTEPSEFGTVSTD